MEKWKQRLGSKATYRCLIGVFERANYKGYADKVRSIVERAVWEGHTRKQLNFDHSSSQLEATSDLRPPATKRLKQEGIYMYSVLTIALLSDYQMLSCVGRFIM